MMNDDIKEVLFSKKDLDKIVKRLGREITQTYQDDELYLVTLLKGAVVFFTDIIREIDLPVEMDFMAVSSYKNGTCSSGEVKIVKDLSEPIAGKNVLIIEDILDSGKTLSYIMNVLEQRGPKSIRICTLFDKPERRTVDVQADYVGTQVPDEFIVGYGLDYAEKYRNLPYVGVLKPEIYSK